MNTFQERQIERTNDLLWQVLGPNGEDFLASDKEATKILISEVEDECYTFLHKALSFYCPRVAVANTLNNEEGISQDTAHMVLMVGILTIIDSLVYRDKFALNEPSKIRRWWTIIYDNFEPNVVAHFKTFLEKNLDEHDLLVLRNKFIFRKGIKMIIKNFKDLAEFLYEVQSLDMQRAAFWSIELGDERVSVTRGEGDMGPTVDPRDIRKLLWKSILNDLKMKGILRTVNPSLEEEKVLIESAGEPETV